MTKRDAEKLLKAVGPCSADRLARAAGVSHVQAYRALRSLMTEGRVTGGIDNLNPRQGIVYAACAREAD